MEDGSYSSDAYTESEDGDFDKEYSTDNDGPEEDDSYDSGEDNIEEDMDDDTEHSSGGSECDNNIKTSVSDDKVLQLVIVFPILITLNDLLRSFWQKTSHRFDFKHYRCVVSKGPVTRELPLCCLL